MERIGIRELKAHASRIIQEVEEHGARYVITKRGQPVAVLVPAGEANTSPETQKSREEALAALFRLGEEISRRRVTDKPSVDILSEMRR